MRSAHPIKKSFYLNDDVNKVAKMLLGKRLVTNFGSITSGIIVETEAYKGQNDKASHAYNMKRTRRTSPMFFDGGISYIYLCYGIHNLFNVVTNKQNFPDAVLVRAIEPQEGIEVMLKRRKLSKLGYNLTSGPGILSKALGITTQSSRKELAKKNNIWLEDDGLEVPYHRILASPRVGVGYAEEDAMLPWRYRIKDSNWVSKAK